MHANGQVTEPRIKEPLPIAPTPGRLLVVMYVQLAILAVLVVGVLFESFVVLPGYAKIADAISAQREADARHLKLIEDSRKRQVRDEAALILQQQQSLKLAAELNKLLKRGD